MRENNKKRLEDNGWKFSNTKEFLQLSNEEMELVELRIELGRLLREKRVNKGYTQANLAKKIGTSQSRLAKMESGDSSVTIDLLLKSLFHLAPRSEIFRI